MQDATYPGERLYEELEHYRNQLNQCNKERDMWFQCYKTMVSDNKSLITRNGELAKEIKALNKSLETRNRLIDVLMKASQDLVDSWNELCEKLEVEQ